MKRTRRDACLRQERYCTGDEPRNCLASPGRQRFRVWIAACGAWRPLSWDDIPPRAVAVKPAHEGVYSSSDAARFLQGFNSKMLASGGKTWAIAVPISLRYEGDLEPGQRVAS